MVGIVKLALARPYTFIVMALLIMIFGVASAVRTPTDLPEHRHSGGQRRLQLYRLAA
jgi:hypothetical protein